MIEFFPPNSRHFCPLFVQIAQMGLIFAQMGSHFAQIHSEYHPKPLFFTQHSHIPFRDTLLKQNTPKPTPKHPFSWPELEIGQNELLSGQFRPKLGKMFEKWAKLF